MRTEHVEARLGLPKGRMQEGVFQLLADAGVQMQRGRREYRPALSLSGFEVKILKPQNIVEMLHHGSRDVGLAGADWVRELGADLVELLDTGLDPVRLVAAAPRELLMDGRLPRDRRLLIASEYEQITRGWIASSGLEAEFVRTYGATEVFPPEDADCIVDNTASGATLDANGMVIADVLMESSTRLYANRAALEVPHLRERIEHLVMLLRSVLEARQRVMVELNVGRENFQRVIEVLPAMREPTVSALNADQGFAVRVAVRREELPGLIPLLKARGGCDIIVTRPVQIVP